MKKFMDKDFLLSSKTAKKLYHNYAAKMPIIDYHCHLIPQQIAEDKHYDNITELWLGGDHYKWRAIRAFGIDEKYITGDAAPKEKFMRWAEVVPYLIGNPLYHWTHLELKRYFDIDEPLCPANAERIWNECNAMLAQADFGAQGLIKKSRVEIICTTDDPCDDLRYHKQIAEDKNFDVKVLPTFRPDKALDIANCAFCDYVKKLSDVCGIEINDFASMKKALDMRIDFFVQNGCRITDHSLETLEFSVPNDALADEALKTALSGNTITSEQIAVYRTTLLVYLGTRYHASGLAMQLHMSALRNNNTPMFEKIGVDTGYDTMNDTNITEILSKILDALEMQNALPKTILYNLNPCHNATLAALAACFNGDGIAGKIQFGSAWWLNDHIDGMTRQMTTLSSIGVLSQFVGMLTDSRSFLSYTRHEYFRRILCNLIATWVENGEVPCNMEILGKVVCDISYNNAKKYFFA